MVPEIFINCLSFSITSPSPFYIPYKYEMQNLRTVIVTADIHEGLYQSPYNIATIQRR